VLMVLAIELRDRRDDEIEGRSHFL
jgi:hypothetical protein